MKRFCNFNLARSVNPIGLLPISIAMGLSLGAIVQTAQAQSTPATTTPSPAPIPAIGFQFEGESKLNQATFPVTEYIGDCPDKTEMQPRDARFTSDQMPPGEHRRVVIRNQTLALPQYETPYTNREYDKGRLSEPTTVRFGRHHESKFLTVTTGLNVFQYDIRERDQVIYSGSFTVSLEPKVTQIRRDATWLRHKTCINPDILHSFYCADMREVEDFRCPGGKVLKRKMADDRPAFTLIRNQTNKTIHFSIENNAYQLAPNNDMKIRRSEDFEIGYDPTCVTCSPKTYLTVRYGSQVNFELSEKTINLRPSQVDFFMRH